MDVTASPIAIRVFRFDPDQDEINWLKHILATYTVNGPQFSTKPVI